MRKFLLGVCLAGLPFAYAGGLHAQMQDDAFNSTIDQVNLEEADMYIVTDENQQMPREPGFSSSMDDDMQSVDVSNEAVRASENVTIVPDDDDYVVQTGQDDAGVSVADPNASIIIVPDNNTDMPPSNNLSDVRQPGPGTPSTMNQLNADRNTGNPAPVDPAMQEAGIQPIPYSGLYYDSDSFQPQQSLQSRPPREVDPKYEPGSRFVVVERNGGADSFGARLVAAQRAMKLGRYSSALELYNKLYATRPNDVEVLMGLAVAQQKSGLDESALLTYEELLDKDPKRVDAMINMLGLLQKQYPSAAYERLVGLWRDNSNNPAVAAQLGMVSAELGNYKDAMRYIGVAASLEPNNPSHYYNMAVISDRAGEVRNAVRFYEEALNTSSMYGAERALPKDQIYNRLAQLRRL